MNKARSRGGMRTGRSDPKNPGKRQTMEKNRARAARKGPALVPKPSAVKSRAQKPGLRRRKQLGAFPAMPEMMPIT